MLLRTRLSWLHHLPRILSPPTSSVTLNELFSPSVPPFFYLYNRIKSFLLHHGLWWGHMEWMCTTWHRAGTQECPERYALPPISVRAGLSVIPSSALCSYGEAPFLFQTPVGEEMKRYLSSVLSLDLDPYFSKWSWAWIETWLHLTCSKPLGSSTTVFGRIPLGTCCKGWRPAPSSVLTLWPGERQRGKSLLTKNELVINRIKAVKGQTVRSAALISLGNGENGSVRGTFLQITQLAGPRGGLAWPFLSIAVPSQDQNTARLWTYFPRLRWL